MTAMSALLLALIAGWLVPAPRLAMAAFLGPWLVALIYQTADIGLGYAVSPPQTVTQFSSVPQVGAPGGTQADDGQRAGAGTGQGVNGHRGGGGGAFCGEPPGLPPAARRPDAPRTARPVPAGPRCPR